MQQDTQQFISLLSFSNPSSAAIVKGKLESEGITCFLRDELTTQVNPLYTQNEGGIKLQVLNTDVDLAIQLLEEMGYTIEDNSSASTFINKIDQMTGKIPFVKSLRFDIRLIVLVTVVIGSLAGILYFETAPTLKERLQNNSWCVERLTYKSKVYPTSTTGLIFQIEGYCPEGLAFSSSNKVRLPGFNTPEVKAKWRILNDKLIIEKCDNFGYVYSGYYALEFNQNRLTLTSTKTRLDCKAQYLKRFF